MQQRDRSFHDPAVHAQAGAVPGAAPSKVRGDLEPAGLVPVDLAVIAAVGVQMLGAAQWLAALAADRRDGLDQRDQRDQLADPGVQHEQEPAQHPATVQTLTP